MNSCLARSEDASLLFTDIIKGDMVLVFPPCVALVVSKLYWAEAKDPSGEDLAVISQSRDLRQRRRIHLVSRLGFCERRQISRSLVGCRLCGVSSPARSPCFVALGHWHRKQIRVDLLPLLVVMVIVMSLQCSLLIHDAP
jgi:hypothetical protein